MGQMSDKYDWAIFFRLVGIARFCLLGRLDPEIPTVQQVVTVLKRVELNLSLHAVLLAHANPKAQRSCGPARLNLIEGLGLCDFQSCKSERLLFPVL